jgi:hypothetical protein
MARPKGSKNKAEVIEDDLLSTEVEVVVTEDVVAQITHKTEKEFIGYHPVTGDEVWI